MSNPAFLFISLLREIPLFCIRIQNMNSEFEMAHALADSANRKKRPFRETGMKDLLNLGQVLSVHARLSPGRLGASDLDRSMSPATSNECACRLASTLLGPSRKNFDPDHCVRTLAESDASFTSPVPTRHIMMSGLPAAVRARHRLDRATKRYRRMQRRVEPGASNLQSLAAADDAEREWRGSA
jgi:hypothetical protein